jgi:hypothetical protein
MIIKRQKGASLLSWIIASGVVILIAITVIKVAPTYLEYNMVSNMMDSMASEPGINKLGKREIHLKLSKYLDINNMDSFLSPKDFEIIKSRKNSKERTIKVKYEVRKHWLANVDIVTSFEHSAKLGRTKAD